MPEAIRRGCIPLVDGGRRSVGAGSAWGVRGMNERDMQTMNDQDLVNGLCEHAEWARANEWETPITLGDDLTEAADRIEAQAKEIENLRGQNRQLMSIIADVTKAGKTWMCQYCAHCKGIVSGMADCDSKKLCVMPYSQFELKRPEPPEVEKC